MRIVRDREMTDREESVRRLTEIVCLCKRDAAGLPRICLPVLDTLHGTNRLEPRCVPVVNPQELPLPRQTKKPGHCLHRHPVCGQHICGPPRIPDTMRRVKRLLPAASDERSERLEEKRHVVDQALRRRAERDSSCLVDRAVRVKKTGKNSAPDFNGVDKILLRDAFFPRAFSEHSEVSERIHDRIAPLVSSV